MDMVHKMWLKETRKLWTKLKSKMENLWEVEMMAKYLIEIKMEESEDE